MKPFSWLGFAPASLVAYPSFSNVAVQAATPMVSAGGGHTCGLLSGGTV
jgi:hypothetical protein